MLHGGYNPDYIPLIAKYRDIVLDEIKTINPLLIIPLGELGFNFLTGLRGIRKYRGSVIYSNMDLGLPRQYKVKPILGPQPYLAQQFELRWISQIDFNNVPKVLNTDPITDNQLKLSIAKSSSELRNFLERSYLHDGFLNFDIETLLGIPTCISFAFNDFEATTVPFLEKSIDSDARALMLTMVAKLLHSPIAKGNQNIKYDWRILERFKFDVQNIIDDPMLAASLLTPELPKNLGFLISIYTDLPYHKDEGKETDIYGRKDREKFYLYCAKDSIGSRRVIAAQKVELEETGQYELYKQLVKLIPIYKKMEDRGLRIDDTQRLKLLAKYETLYNIQLLKLKGLVGREVNPQSPVQMDHLIFDDLGFKKGRYVKDTGEESLEWLIEFGESKHSPIHGKLILSVVISARKVHKVIEYLHTAPYPDGKWRCEYNLAGAETGRTTAGAKEGKLGTGGTTDRLITLVPGKKGNKIELTKLGRSFQTIAKHGFKIDGETYGKELRSIFIPSPGYSFVEIDLSQAEARVDAVLAGNFDILRVFDGPVGIHRLTGSWVFGCKPEEIKKNTEEYHMAKTVRHAAERNMKADRMVMMTQNPVKECQHALDRIHAEQPEIRGVYHREIREAIDRTRTLVAPNGRTRQFLSRIDDHLYNAAISQLPQCIVSDQTKTSLIPTFQEVDEFSFLINEAHDGTLAEVLIGKEMDYAMAYKKNIETPIDFRGCTLSRDFQLVIPCEVSISKGSWQDLEDVKI
jgi:DNA polymerase I-like protein with 3'-5' exonuclease and polymerase domains